MSAKCATQRLRGEQSIRSDPAFESHSLEGGGAAPGTGEGFAVFTVMPGGESVAPGALEALCEKMAGVSALRLDAARGKIHVLYDGAPSTLQQVEHELTRFGLDIRHQEEPPVSGPHAPVNERLS